MQAAHAHPIEIAEEEAALVAAFLKKQLRSHIVAVMPDNQIPTWKMKKGHGNTPETFAAWHTSCATKFPGAQLLNEMPFNAALEVYRAALAQPILTRH